MALRFAIVGCGRIAPRHIDSLNRLEEADVVAYVDPILERAQGFHEKHRGRLPSKVFSSIPELISWGQFDVACVCTPSGLHADHAVALMKAGKHVVVEKPMALKLSDADHMVATAEACGVSLFVVKQNRFNLPVQAVRRAFNEGRFGRMVMGTVRVRWCRTQAYYDQADWRGKWSMDGGVFSNQASHHIDLLEWFMGDVDTVYAKTATQLVRIECEDTGLAVLRFKSGALGVIEATTATRPVDLEGSLSLLGERGTAEVGGFAVNKIRSFNFVERRPEDADVLSQFSEVPPSVYGFGHFSYLKNVVEALKGREKPAVDGVEGRRSLELIHALYVSAQTGQELKMSERRWESRLGQGSS